MIEMRYLQLLSLIPGGPLSHKILSRDGTCVMSGSEILLCEAAHLIPHSKGDAVRGSFFQSSSSVSLVRNYDTIRKKTLSRKYPRNALLLATTGVWIFRLRPAFVG